MWVFIFIFILILSYEPSNLAAQIHPHIKRVTPNLLQNSQFKGTGHWTPVRGATYDVQVSRTAGSGSFLLPPISGGPTVVSHHVSVKPGNIYTISMYMKSESWPPPSVIIFATYYDNNGQYVGQSIGSRQGNTKPGVWEETALQFTPTANQHNVQVMAYRQEPMPSPTSKIWVDDFYLGEGVGYEQPPSPKKAFTGSVTRFDSLGNIEMKQKGKWRPFFPLCIFADFRRPQTGPDRLQLFSDQGWNCIIWASANSHIQRAKNAVSSFNPNGMVSGFQIAQYILPDGWARGDIADLSQKIANLGTLSDHLLFWYWDNEVSWQEWDIPLRVTNTIKTLDADQNGVRRRPIYILQGNHGMARAYKHNGEDFGDLTGSYIVGDTGGAGGAPGGLNVLASIEGQVLPAIFAQINLGVGKQFKAKLYAAIAGGAKAMGFWEDNYHGTRADTLVWWPDFPTIRREIDAMMPLIRQSHWTQWTATTPDRVSFGTRNLNGEGHLIISNLNPSSVNATFTISDLTYTPVEVHDYFTGASTPYNSNQFVMTLPAYGARVVKLTSGSAAALSPPVPEHPRLLGTD